MEEYVSYHKIIQLFQDYQISQQGIGLNSFGHGNVVMFGMTESGMTPTYPFLFVTPQNISYDENIITYTMQLIFADRINDDMSNEIDVISDMDIQARRFMSYIRRGMNQTPDLYNKMDIVLPTNAVPFQERFNDFVGGVALDCNFVVFTDINACDYYDDLPTTSVYSQVLDFISPTQYNSIVYRCDGTPVEYCYSSDNQYNITDLVALFNTPPPDPLPGGCGDPTYCYCWTTYGTYYDNGDGRIRCEMPTSLYNTLCPTGTLTLDVIYD